ncbi:hypothetical protein HDZ31DRAFT_68627 [Schizophyllum fasciatum]
MELGRKPSKPACARVPSQSQIFDKVQMLVSEEHRKVEGGINLVVRRFSGSLEEPFPEPAVENAGEGEKEAVSGDARQTDLNEDTIDAEVIDLFGVTIDNFRFIFGTPNPFMTCETVVKGPTVTWEAGTALETVQRPVEHHCSRLASTDSFENDVRIEDHGIGEAAKDVRGSVESLADTNRNSAGYVGYEHIYGIYGVGFANVVANADQAGTLGVTKRLRTMITFDNGRWWSPTRAPQGSSCNTSKIENCALHIHSVTTLHNFGRVFSSPAPGYVMAVGSVAPYEDSDTLRYPPLLQRWPHLDPHRTRARAGQVARRDQSDKKSMTSPASAVKATTAVTSPLFAKTPVAYLRDQSLYQQGRPDETH